MSARGQQIGHATPAPRAHPRPMDYHDRSALAGHDLFPVCFIRSVPRPRAKNSGVISRGWNAEDIVIRRIARTFTNSPTHGDTCPTIVRNGGSMKIRYGMPRRIVASGALAAALLVPVLAAAQQPPAAALGATPPPEALPKVEVTFEARVTLAPATVVGETVVGHRQYIPITGGTVAGPKFKSQVIPGGWD